MDTFLCSVPLYNSSSSLFTPGGQYNRYKNCTIRGPFFIYNKAVCWQVVDTFQGLCYLPRVEVREVKRALNDNDETTRQVLYMHVAFLFTKLEDQSSMAKGNWFNIICSFIHSLIGSFIPFSFVFIFSFIHSLIHSFVYSFLHYSHLFILSFIPIFIHSFINSFIHSFYSIIHLFVPIFIHVCICSFINS